MPDPLATLADLKLRLEVTEFGMDSYLTSLLDRATAKIESIVGRRLTLAGWTEYIDGDGSEYLNLRNGPVTTIGSVSDATYSSSGAVTTASIAAGQWFARGLASENWKLRGYVQAFGWAWSKGEQNYCVAYTSGYSTSSTVSSAPADLQEACLYAAVWMKNKRKDAATSSRDVGGGHLGGFKDEDVLNRELRSMIAAYVPL